MREAIKEAEAGMRLGRGGPFGCVIVRKGKIIARGNNRARKVAIALMLLTILALGVAVSIGSLIGRAR